MQIKMTGLLYSLSCALLFAYVASTTLCRNDSKFLTWKEEKCIPEEVCGEIKLDEIPDVTGQLPTSLFCGSHSSRLFNLYDMNGIRDCYANKKICLLGDSTIEETMHDMVTLLSGLGPNRAKFLEYYRLVSAHSSNPINLAFKDVQVHMMSHFPFAHRITKVLVPTLKIEIYHHYTGHVDVSQNRGGIGALLFRLENLFASELHNCDALVMNSASHDYATDPTNPDCLIPWTANNTCLSTNYLPAIHNLHRLIDKLYHNTTTKVYWKSEAFAAHLDGFIPDSVKQELELKVAHAFRHSILPVSVSASVGSSSSEIGQRALHPVRFINVSAVLARVPAQCNVAFNHHIGEASSWDTTPPHPFPFLWSSVSTQTVVDHVCRGFQNSSSLRS